MFNFLRNLIPERSQIRLFYHKLSAIIANIIFWFPSRKIKIIGVTGTSGKSTTVELIQQILQKGGKKCGSISTINIRIGEKISPNNTFRTSLRPWSLQKLLRAMIRNKCEYVVIEVSSHAIDQHRVWGVVFDSLVLTNIYDNEHLDYHGTFSDYLCTKLKIFKKLNHSYRKPHTAKNFILNADSEQMEVLENFVADKKWTFARSKSADIRAEKIVYESKSTSFFLRVPNNEIQISTCLVGEHNLENLLAAITVAVCCHLSIEKIAEIIKSLPGISGRLESIDCGQNFSVIVDFSYKPSALSAVLKTLKQITKKRIIVIWGGAGGRDQKNWEESAKVLNNNADEIILTTDDPGKTNPKKINKIIREKINRSEGDNFFEIIDRYEAIRYGIYSAEEGDIVLIAGRGHEQFQAIGNSKIKFDDREISREILSTMM